MLQPWINPDATGSHPAPQEGQLHKVITLYGHTFSIFYGYYEPYERDNPNIDPMPIYPDFLKEPCYTPEGAKLVTKMQEACPHYRGRSVPEKDCADCYYYEQGEDLIGICTCRRNQRDQIMKREESI